MHVPFLLAVMLIMVVVENMSLHLALTLTSCVTRRKLCHTLSLSLPHSYKKSCYSELSGVHSWTVQMHPSSSGVLYPDTLSFFSFFSKKVHACVIGNGVDTGQKKEKCSIQTSHISSPEVGIPEKSSSTKRTIHCFSLAPSPTRSLPDPS